MLVQGVGAASVMLATVWLGASVGPVLQGEFSRVKAEVEFIAAFAMFGLPQALFFFVKSGRLDPDAALRWASSSALLALCIGAASSLLDGTRRSATEIGALALAVGLSVLHGQLRALLLVGQRTEWFNVVTALPQLALLVGVVVLVTIGSVDDATWPWLFAIGFGAAAALAWWRLGRTASVARSVPGVAWRELGCYGFAAWASAALSTAAVLVVQRWVHATGGATGLGIFTMAMTLLQVPLTPVSYAAPLLLRRWMEQPGGRPSRRWAGKLFVTMLAGAAVLWLASPWWPRLGFGAQYDGLTRALAVLLVGGAAEAASRVLAVQANATGAPWIAVRSEAARWAVLCLGWSMPLPTGLMSVCLVWASAALAAAAVFVWHARSVPVASPE